MKKRFLEAYEESREEQVEQRKLHEKHKIADENIVVVEKNNMIKFSVRSAAALVRMAASILLLILAAIGLLCLIYPDTRTEFMQIANHLYIQVKQYINMN